MKEKTTTLSLYLLYSSTFYVSKVTVHVLLTFSTVEMLRNTYFKIKKKLKIDFHKSQLFFE